PLAARVRLGAERLHAHRLQRHRPGGGAERHRQQHLSPVAHVRGGDQHRVLRHIVMNITTRRTLVATALLLVAPAFAGVTFAGCTDVTVEPKSTVSTANIFSDTTS